MFSFGAKAAFVITSTADCIIIYYYQIITVAHTLLLVFMGTEVAAEWRLGVTPGQGQTDRR